MKCLKQIKKRVNVKTKTFPPSSQTIEAVVIFSMVHVLADNIYNVTYNIAFLFLYFYFSKWKRNNKIFMEKG